jgi:DNA-binding transcriptional regulator GbsR (MarR family)
VSRVPERRDGDEVHRFIERFASVLSEAGIPRMPARVFVALLVTDSGRLTAAEIVDLLHVSPAAVSGAMRYLVPLNMVGRERERGSRRDVYRVHDDVWYEVSLRQDQVLTRWETSLREGITALGRDTPAGRRLVETHEYVDFIRAELPAIRTKWHERQSELRAQLSEPGSRR